MDVDEEQASGDPVQNMDVESSLGDKTEHAESSTSRDINHRDNAQMKLSSNNNRTNRQLAVRQKIEQYFHRLTQGCDRENCTNPNCASNPSQKKLSGNEAAVKALQLLQQKAEICWLKSEEAAAPASLPSSSQKNVHSKPVAMDTNGLKAHSISPNAFIPRGVATPESSGLPHDATKNKASATFKQRRSDVEVLRVREVKYLTEEMVDDLIKQCQEEEERQYAENTEGEKQEAKDPYLPLFRSLNEVFSSMEGLNRSFVMKSPNTSKAVTNTDEGDDDSKMEVDASPITTDSLDENAGDAKHSDPANPDGGTHTPFMNLIQSFSPNAGVIGLSNAPNSSGLRRTGAVKKKLLGARPKVQANVKVFAPTVDIESVRRVYEKLHDIEKAESALVSSLQILSMEIEVQLTIMKQLQKTTINPNVFIIVMENPLLHSPEYLVTALPSFCKAMAALPLQAIATLAKWWSQYEAEALQRMVERLQQLLTYKVLQLQLADDIETRQLDLHKNEVIAAAVKCLKIFYYASLLGGKIEKSEQYTFKTSDSSSGSFASAFGLEDDEYGAFERKVWSDPLSDILKVSDSDVTESLLPIEVFQNELLNETFNVYNDFTDNVIEKPGSDQFSLMHYPFILNTVNKTTYFFCDNKIQMVSGRRMMVVESILNRSPVNLYLRLKVRRTHVIDDALVRLELIANENPRDLRKQLYVEFEGEQGVDEGGVSKEFFQLVVDQIFNPDYGMFTYDEDTNLFWFNAHSFENHAQFTLIGIVLGLAIYNSCILDIKFPPVVYKKLFGKKGRFEDMEHSHPQLYKGLKDVLTYEGNVEEDLMATFSVRYSDMFGSIRSHELEPDGENIPVTAENREKFVELYSNWLLNESIAEQFDAFRHGFELVVAKSPLKYLFRTDELEILISGSQEYDFKSLESTTEYDGGFNKDSKTVHDFWSVVHEMSEKDKKKLLQFTTGTDRAPVGGLSQLRLVIARNGPDSDRLPTAHTCFNVILLPDYKDREKLKERLHKAITYAKGFGML